MDENEDYERFTEFFKDVFPEVQKFGKIISFKCCNNITPHLRGNVFVQYDDIKSAISAYIDLNGRFYAGNRLRVQFSQMNDWKIAICAYNGTNFCPKSAECNFLHVFENPNLEENEEKKKRSVSKEKEEENVKKQKKSDKRSRSRSRKKDKKKDKKRSREKNYKEYDSKKKKNKSKSRSR